MEIVLKMMLTYRDGMSFTWEGHQLKITIVSSQNLEYTVEYTYDSNGIRTGKLVNGTKTTYFLDGSTIIAQQTDSDVLWFLYDSDRTLVGFTYNDTAYYYTKNVQGDVTGIVDSNVNLVAEYTYDAWGKLLSTTYENGYEEIAQANPFRYRGYYYDSETGLYYLNDRYYDPVTCRMLNADHIEVLSSSITSMVDKNLFSYCDNDPINRADDEGDFWHILAGAAIGAIIGGASQILSNKLTGNKWSEGLGTAMVTGAVSGALTASGVGLGWIIAGNAAISMAGNAYDQITNNDGLSNFSAEDMITEGVIGGATGALGGEGKGSKNLMNLGKQSVKRTTKVLRYQGVKAATKNLPKVAKYYVKSTRSFYEELISPQNIISDLISSTISTLLNEDKVKQPVQSMLGW